VSAEIWMIAEAKAKFGELVDKARTNGNLAEFFAESRNCPSLRPHRGALPGRQQADRSRRTPSSRPRPSDST
jgi:hypothetical protein